MRSFLALSSICWTSIVAQSSAAGLDAGRPSSKESLNEDFQWSQIVPSKSLVYVPCFDGFQCARLEVPLDWNSTDPQSERLNLAVIRLPAKVPITDSRYGGAILLNPGGPGGSGIAIGISAGKLVQRVVDAAYENGSDQYVSSSEDARYFDIMSFDPRGVENTTPFHTCFKTHKDYIEWDIKTDGILGTEEQPFMQYWQRQLANSQGCVYDPHTNPDGSKVALFANTPMVVRDMIEIIERHGEWREAEATRQIDYSYSGYQAPQIPLNGPIDLEDRLKWRPGEEQLNYWGFSYGTVLGATFLTLQPHRAQRVVLDGVDDSDDYYSGFWEKNLRDTDKVMDNFFEYCAQAGPDRCALHTGSSAKDIRERWDSVIQLIKEQGAIPVPGYGRRSPEVITLSDISAVTIEALYQPLLKAEKLAELMATLLEGNGTAFADWKHENREDFQIKPSCSSIDPNRPECILDNGISDAATAILCLDGGAESMINVSASDYKQYWKMLRSQSKWLGDYWASIRINCASWPARAQWKIPHPVGSNATRPNATLFVSNTYDDVTPLHAAKKMASRFAGSTLLQVDIDGHCSFANPSFCVGKTIRQYFQTGQVPANGKLCLPHIRQFVGKEAPNVEPLPQRELIGKEDGELMQALIELSGVGGRNFWGKNPDDESEIRRVMEAMWP